jgi:predicted DNA-binding transcriptional regulator YafY
MAAIIAEPNVRLMTDVECRAVRLYKMRLMFLAGGSYTSAELAEHFNVTPVTIRKDLNALGRIGLPLICVTETRWRLVKEGE